jgi:hypothetical protein
MHYGKDFENNLQTNCTKFIFFSTFQLKQQCLLMALICHDAYWEGISVFGSLAFASIPLLILHLINRLPAAFRKV